MASHWQFKERTSILYAKRRIHDLREKYKRPKYCGPEHIWYTIWNARLVRLVENCRSLVIGPQTWVSHYPEDDDGSTVPRSRIPDFTISRIFSKRLAKTADGNLRMEFETMKIIALLEVKPPPVDTTDVQIGLAIGEARHDLVEQAEIFLSGDKGCKAIIGISIAGDWWFYETFTIHNTKLRSKNVDPTFKDPGPSLHGRPRVTPTSLRPVYQLGTPQSDAAMDKMMDEMKKLRGFARYANTQF